MIQLGSILAVMWLYRAKIIHIVDAACRRTPTRRHFALMILVAFAPAVVAGVLLADFVTTVLYESPQVFATTFIVGGIVMLVVERFRPAPTVVDADRTPLARALGIGAVPGAGDGSGRVAIRRDHRRRHADGPRSPRGRGVLVLPGDADDDGGVRARACSKVRHHLAPERALEIAIGFVMAFVASLPGRQAVPRASSGDRGSRRSPGTASCSGWPCSAAIAARWL